MAEKADRSDSGTGGLKRTLRKAQKRLAREKFRSRSRNWAAHAME